MIEAYPVNQKRRILAMDPESLTEEDRQILVAELRTDLSVDRWVMQNERDRLKNIEAHLKDLSDRINETKALAYKYGVEL